MFKCEYCEYKEHDCLCRNVLDKMRCGSFIPNVDEIKKFADENDISVMETIELIKMCCR